MAKPQIEASELAKLLRYDATTGKLWWLERDAETMPDSRSRNIFNTRYAGKEAFTYQMPHQHLQGQIHARGYLAHRVAWALHHGTWPKNQIDHINGDPTDNRIANLRDVVSRQNQRNVKRSCVNTSGVIGVGWDGARSRWRARIKNDAGREIQLGRFANFDDAVYARKKAERRLGYHENHGR